MAELSLVFIPQMLAKCARRRPAKLSQPAPFIALALFMLLEAKVEPALG